MFSQLYTKHACKENATYPLIYILITDRVKEIYSEFLKCLKTRKSNFNSLNLKVNFENAFISISEKMS